MISFRLKIRNSLPNRRTLVLEPWTTEITIDPARIVTVVVEGGMGESLEVELFEDRVILYSFDSEGALLTPLDVPEGK